ncbi:MAG: cyclic beta 1-2 glucan synthetase [Proteobacteria bacterium]|nr:cyclic beta 1-2 glucan synthetase [Pseudomonadota bacterium]
MYHVWTSLRGNGLSKKLACVEPPLRAELFSADQMEQHGKTLANSHTLSTGHPRDRLLKRLAENEGILIGVHNLLTEAVKASRRITPAGEWLLDNFYLIEDQIRTARRHLPKGYSRELPRLLNGPSAALPRVYDIALEMISHGDGRVDPEILSRFAAAYQAVTTLKLGELWAIPIMLRLALIENLRRVAARIATDRIDRNLADYWADQMTESAVKDPKSLILVIADMARSNPPLVGSFIAEMTRRLQGQGPALSLPLTWFEQRLSECGQTIRQLVQAENQQQAADQVSMSNSIGSLRFLSAMDWKEFVESMSIVDQTLRKDPCGVYSKMDFSTRDRYRHVVEKIAKQSNFSESEVTYKAIGLAQKGANGNNGDNRTAHVGFYLIDKGLPQLEQAMEMRLSLYEHLQRWGRRFPFPLFLGTILLLTAIFSGALLTEAHIGTLPGWAIALIGLLSVLSISQLAVSLVNLIATLLATPYPLPRMDFSKGIPPKYRTLTVVPAMLTGTQNIEDLIEALEVRFLANRDANLHFGLLTDFRDAQEEILPEDEPLLRLASQRIEELNNKYGHYQGNIFFLFHRPRQWNSKERIWMGYERKRGKLSELNALLRGGENARDRFSLVIGDTAVLSSIKYVITLDIDTQLPRDAAWQFVGTMAHPLNTSQYNEDKQRVCDGYGILQPRVAVSLPVMNRSRYAAMCGNEPGVDPYTRAVSDVYQDLFGEGSFIGKGIYEVDTFEQTLKGRFPENRILSHDLLEGCYARSGLLSDVMLYEDYPSHYNTDVSRRHRWIRGDWQLLRWLLPSVPCPNARFQKNPLSWLSQWKIFDNLRRSLVPAALTVLLLLGWTILPATLFFTLAVLGIILIPCLVAFLLQALKKPDDVLLSQHLATSLHSAGRNMAQASFTLACLPYEAFFSLDAIIRTCWRMLFTHKRLLEWSTSDEQHGSNYTNIGSFYRSMWIAPVLAGATVIKLLLSNPVTLAVAWPILGLWFVSPAIARWFSLPIARREAKLTAGQITFLRKLSRRTWAFFETFVGPEDHWLPPDNFQEHPVAVIAHRTSPTNMGMALLANLSAYDFGYITAGQLIERTANALHTMEALERHRDHFYNWYDTQSLQPLQPTYISTVDSGNLAGHLLVLRQGLLALPDDRIHESQVFEGIRDTVRILGDMDVKTASDQLVQLNKLLKSAIDSPPTTLAAARLCLDQLATSAKIIVTGINVLDADPESQTLWWAHALARQCDTALDELTFLAAWTSLPDSPDGLSGMPDIEEIPTLRQLSNLDTGTHGALPWADSVQRAGERIRAIEELAQKIDELSRMKYDFLYDKSCNLLAIGYNVGERRRDTSYYDLLASEARFCSFIAIAQGQLPQENWFALGRLLTTAGGDQILLSWSGSMFEYLMPLLVMPTYEHTLLDQTCKAAVTRQIHYGRKRGVPWGSSESGYNATDVNLNYQYRAFGIPGLGLKRGLADDLVIAPYATALALMVAPEEACLNLERLAAEGFAGTYGFFEAIDYTPSRLQRGQSSAVVRSFMAHHQGMSFLSLAYVLLDRPMQKRFESEPMFQATMLLLQERIPKAAAFYTHSGELSDHQAELLGAEAPIRVFGSPNTPKPEVHLLSNGRYHMMITNAGGGYSRWKDMAVTRWREDSTCDNWGSFCYLRDVASGEFWSTAYQPALKQADKYETIFSEAKAEFRCRIHDIDTHTEIAVSPEDDIELRRITIINRSGKRRSIDITSYAEVVLASPAADALHPAFSNLFVQTEILNRQRAILCTRRPRSQGEAAPWMFHLMAVHGADIEEISYETDRLQFIGRGNTVANPQAMINTSALSGSEGSVLDPIVSIRYRITIDAEEAATVNIVSGIGETRDAALSLVGKYQDRRLADRVFDLAWTHSDIFLRQINSTEADAQLYGRLAGSVIYANASLRANTSVIIKNQRGQSGLWGYAISGDLPIVILRIEDPANIELVRQLIQAHTYWRLKGLAVDLVIWNEDHAGYRQQLHEQIMGLIAAGVGTHLTDQPGGIFVRPSDQISGEERILLQTVARAIITDSRGMLADQIKPRSLALVESTVPILTPTRTHRSAPPAVPAMPRNDLLFFNGFGGFTPDGREYIITTTHDQVTPAPWVNILANPNFGTVISESGSAYTWAENAHEFRITPWHNDPVSDASGEAFYLRDEERGHFWSPMPLPKRGVTPYVIRHGFGYTVFEHLERGIRSEVWVYVAMDASIKFTVLKIKNVSDRLRMLSATGYAEWVLGDLRPKSTMHVITEIDSNSGALFARNPYNTEFPNRIAFFDVDEANRTVSGDRTEFLGRNGTLASPAAMTRVRLSGRVGAALDPCAAIQVPFELAAGQEREIVFRLGVGRDTGDAGNLVRRFRGTAASHQSLEKVWQYWRHTLGAVNVETPDQSLNMLTNGWLLYQTIACRLWARSGYYQSGGAFGFRDQLQDVMALIHTEPHLVREHLLLAAGRQFTEGDVQHWWHPPVGRGVRTQCSDDYLWLPLAMCRYVRSTGDYGVLDETIHFLQGRPINANEDSYYDLPGRSHESAGLYEHCVRAILKGLNYGEHGLPLIGSGDWNDGMNMVGIEGKGESIWLGFFLYAVLMQFTEVARRRGDINFAERCEAEAASLRGNIEQHGWDGGWYRRAYFDNGSPLGSMSNTECRIDSIAQSWSVLSGAGDTERSRIAMEAVDQHLVHREQALIQLLDPPFDKSDLNPGYIKGYVPGVRENGGQYTHGAIWMAMAFAKLGDSQRAWELMTMINPINHARSPESVGIYKVEPYVIAADVYALSPHTGRGGWTWYSGSAGWMYRLITESLLGLRLEVDRLSFAPLLPADWKGFTVHYRYRETVYHIAILRRQVGDDTTSVTVDGTPQHDKTITLIDDLQEHLVEVKIPV